MANKKPEGFAGPDPASPGLASSATVCPESCFSANSEKAELSPCCGSDVVPNYASGC